MPSKALKFSLIGALLVVLSACELLSKPKIEVTPIAEPEPIQNSLPSSAPLQNASRIDTAYAQKTLRSIGFDAGQIDGIWGPRSAQAIREFEEKFGLASANGFLSELNLFMLEKISNTNRPPRRLSSTKTVRSGIAAKLDSSTPLAQAPQLVFLDHSHKMLAKPNPFSEQLAELPPGTGIYVISEQDGWFEVESEDKQRGFIKAD